MEMEKVKPATGRLSHGRDLPRLHDPARGSDPRPR